MARFFGVVGYGSSQENPPGSGIWEDVIDEYHYQGDVVRNLRRLEYGGGPTNDLNPDVSVGNSISVVADEYANHNFHNIRYVRWAGVCWIVTSVDVREPRLILSLGGVYNGPTA